MAGSCKQGNETSDRGVLPGTCQQAIFYISFSFWHLEVGTRKVYTYINVCVSIF